MDFNECDMFGYMNKIIQKDMGEIISCPNLDWSKLNNKSVLITGANSQIATYVVYTLMFIVEKLGVNTKVIALCRNADSATRNFGNFIGRDDFSIIYQDICVEIDFNEDVDYIFHFAGNASPYYIKNDPVGILQSNLIGTFNVLQFAHKHNTRKVIFASTREVYGENANKDELFESDFGYVNPMDDRSCYPESKRAAESILKSYYLQYGINFNTIRIAHTYGPGMKISKDGRIMSDLLSNVINGENIVLKSKGDALRSFCYITDTIRALFLILFEGDDACAYNLANENDEISIKALAEKLVSMYSDKKLSVVYDIPANLPMAYCNYKRVKLNVDKLSALGWMPQVCIEDGIRRTVDSF